MQLKHIFRANKRRLMLFFISIKFEPVNIFNKLISYLLMYIINTKTHFFDTRHQHNRNTSKSTVEHMKEEEEGGRKPLSLQQLATLLASSKEVTKEHTRDSYGKPAQRVTETRPKPSCHHKRLEREQNKVFQTLSITLLHPAASHQSPPKLLEEVVESVLVAL